MILTWRPDVVGEELREVLRRRLPAALSSRSEATVRNQQLGNLQLGVLVLLRVEVASLGLLGQLPAVALLLLLLSLHVTSDL